jgi:segregation and condensation protein A
VSEVELSEQVEAGNAGYSVSLPSFEGPLDLLLHLCQKHELDILDIPIGFVTEKYLEYLAVMQLMNLDVASEYLVMAATLAHIKSKMLLPAPPPGQEDDLNLEEEADPREALIRRLLEYQKYKKAGEDLSARGVVGRDVFGRGSPTEEAVQTGLPPLAQVQLFSLVEAFQRVLSKSKITLSHDIVHERITLTDRINELVDVLRVRRKIAFDELFAEATTRFELVITFLALLEMTKLRMTRLYQADFESGIYIEFSAQVTADDEATAEAPPTEAAPEAPPAEEPAPIAAVAEPATPSEVETQPEILPEPEAEAEAQAPETDDGVT